jgi:hypothetical protein
MTDHELLGYFLIHSETDRALFSRAQYVRLKLLAGEPVENPERLPRMFPVWSPEAKPLVEKARVACRALVAEVEANGWEDDPLAMKKVGPPPLRKGYTELNCPSGQAGVTTGSGVGAP